MNERLSSQPERLIDKNLLDACIHCGLCLPACPTYLATGRETESPRGRIYLLNLWQSGEQELTPRLVEHIDSCLGCLGCQTACPSGVKYDRILNAARPELVKTKSKFSRQVMRFAFEKVLPDYKLLRQLGNLFRIWQRLQGRALLKMISAVLPLPFVKRLSVWESYLPQIPPFVRLPRQSWNVGGKEGTVQFFTSCVMDVFYGPANHAAVRLLRAQAQVVEVPKQTCCGALAFHAGESDITEALAKRNIELFEGHEGPIVVTAAGCGAMLKEYDSLFANDDEWKDRASQFAGRVCDIAEFLAGHRFSENISSKARAPVKSVAYHAACHLAHAQNVRLAPQKLLEQMINDVKVQASRKNLPVMRLIPLMDAEHCCGSAGIFNILHPDLSNQVLDAKMEKLKKTEADCVVTSNPGCLLQLESGVRRSRMSMKVMHLAEILDQAYNLQNQDD